MTNESEPTAPFPGFIGELVREDDEVLIKMAWRQATVYIRPTVSEPMTDPSLKYALEQFDRMREAWRNR